MKYPYSTYNAPLPGYGTSLVDRINVYLHFRKYVKMLTDRWLLLLICASVGLGVGVWLAMTKPDKFRAQSILAVPPRVSMGGLSRAQIEDDSQKFAENTLQQMASGTVLAKVLAKLQEGRDNTNKLVRPELQPTQGRGNTFQMVVISTNFDYAQKFAAAWAQEFVEYKKQQRSGALHSATAQLDREILAYERDLENARDQLIDFRRKYNIADFRDTGSRKRDSLERAKAEQQAIQNEIKIYENATAQELATGAINPSEKTAPKRTVTPGNDSDEEAGNRFASGSAYPQLKLELLALEAQYAERLASLKTNHPYMRELVRRMETKTREIGDSLKLVEEARQARLRSLKISEQALQPLIDELTQEVLESTSLQNEYERLVNAENSLKGQVEQLRNNKTSMGRVNADEDVFIIVTLGEGDPVAFEPNRPYIISAGALGGLMVGIGLLYLLYRLDDRLDTPEAIEESLEEPVMGQLPEVERKHYKEGYLLLTRMKSHTMFAESLRGVRSALLLSPEGTSKRMLAVTSAVPGDGKTTFTTNFSVILANAGNKTLLIDADLRRGNINGYFEQPLEGGLTEVLEGDLSLAEAIRETPIKNLHFMRAGERPSNPSELLLGPRTKEIIMELRRDFDYVIFDCPPLTAIDDTFSIAAYLDGLFFVVRAGKTSMRFAKMGVNTIRQRGAPILGLIVNGVPIDNPYYYYTTYYYASYYHRPLSPDENLYQERRSRRADKDKAAASNRAGQPAALANAADPESNGQG
jgi:polysaccharide biosynthesis transport protein